jgi:hypothetical protein
MEARLHLAVKIYQEGRVENSEPLRGFGQKGEMVHERNSPDLVAQRVVKLTVGEVAYLSQDYDKSRA